MLHANRTFYAAFNNVFAHAIKKLDHQLVQLSSTESYCLPVLTYATGGLTFTQRQLYELSVV
jgi:hypothetical protein